MSPMDYLAWVAMGLVMIQFCLFSANRHVLGWWTGIAAAISWAVYATATAQWPVLGLQVFLFGVAVYTLKKLRRQQESSGLSRRNVVESRNHRKGASKHSHTGGDYDPITGEIYDGHDHL